MFPALPIQLLAILFLPWESQRTSADSAQGWSYGWACVLNQRFTAAVFRFQKGKKILLLLQKAIETEEQRNLHRDEVNSRKINQNKTELHHIGSLHILLYLPGKPGGHGTAAVLTGRPGQSVLPSVKTSDSLSP